MDADTQLGDYDIHLAGNLFIGFDRDFFLEVLELCKRRGFNHFVDTVAIANLGDDPRSLETK